MAALDEDRFRQQLRLFEAISATCPDLIHVFDLDGRLVYANRRLLEVWGKTPEQAMGKSLYELGYPQWHADTHVRELRQVVETKGSIKGEVSFTGVSGIAGVYEYIFSPVLGPDGDVDLILGTSRDVTERERAEAARQESLARVKRQAQIFDTALSHTKDFAYVFDRDGRFIYVNKPLLDLWGLRLDDAVGKNFFDLQYPHELAAKLQRQIRQVIDTQSVLVDETPYTSPTGVPGYYEYIFSPVFAADGTVELVAGNTRVITARKNLETERERLLAALENERSRLAAVIEHAPAFICTLRGPDHIIELANERYYEAVGQRDLVGKAVRDAIPEVRGQGYLQLLDDVYRTGETFVGREMPLLLRRAGGAALEQRFVNFVYQALREADGSISGIFVHGVDVTDLILGREALNAANARLEERVLERTAELTEVNGKFQAMYDQGIFAGFLDLDGTVIDANRSSLEQCGFVREDVVGKRFWDCGWWNGSPALQAWVRAGFDRAAAGTAFRGESVYLTADGSERVVEFAMVPIKDDAGRVMFVMPTGIDVTDRARAEQIRRTGEILLESEARFRQLADTLPQMVWVTRPDGYHEYYNKRWYEFTGLPEGSTDGDGWNGVFHPDDQGRAWERWRHSLATGDPYEIEYRLQHHSGEYCWTLGRALPIRDERGDIQRWFGTCTNIDALKRLTAERECLLENEQVARAEAEAASRAKDHFLAVLSHELRTPLAPVVMMVPAMELDPEMPFKFREDLAMVRRNIDLEVKLIDDLLDLSRVTSGKLRLQMQFVRVHELLRHVVQSSAGETAGKRLRVRDDLRADNDLMTGDPARLQQVFWNLLRNAIKFTSDGGDIIVSTWNGDDGRLHVEVRDTGVGIRPDILPRIFDAFEQGELRMTRQFGGLGLGLAIAKAVVEMHGGSIRAASDGPGRGATFTVELETVDRALATEPDAVVAPAAARQHPRSRVLLVEDHPDTSRAMARLLSSSGYDVRSANSVASALQLAAAEPFDIIVSDIGLPDATGYELMEQIKGRHGISGIALSGYGMEEDMRKSRDAGFVDHVVKPVNVAQLEAAIERVLNSRARSRADASTF